MTTTNNQPQTVQISLGDLAGLAEAEAVDMLRAQGLTAATADQMRASATIREAARNSPDEAA